MAEEVIYDQIENGGDPDPLGLRKKLASKQVAPDPLGLRAKLIAEKPVEQPQQAFQIQISQPTFKSAPAQITKEFTDQKPKDELAPLKLEGKARVAHEAIQNELVGNKDIKAEMIKQRRFEQVASNISVAKTDMPKTQTEIDIQRLIPQATKPQDIPVTDEDLAKEDIDIQADRGKAIRLMEEAMKKYPEKAKEIQKNLYTIDAFNSLEPDQHDRVSKIEDNAKQIAKGNLIYDARSNKLIKPLGLVGAKIGIKPIAPIPLSNSFKQAAFNVLKSRGHELGRAGLQGLAVGGVC